MAELSVANARRRPSSPSLIPPSSCTSPSRLRRPADRHCRPGRGHQRRPVVPDPARRHRLGQDLHHGQCDRPRRAAPPSCSRPTRRWPRSCIRSSASSSRERGRIFRQLLRLLPARSLRAAARPVHRKGLVDQRAYRADAPVVHQVADGAARRRHRGHRVGHLRYRQSERIPPDDPDAAPQGQGLPARRHRAPDPDAVHPQRSRLRPRHLPRARRHHRHLPRRACRTGDPGRDLRRRDRQRCSCSIRSPGACARRSRALPSIRVRTT
jgi:hypothetical protein